jgi:hypothetical protein
MDSISLLAATPEFQPATVPFRIDKFFGGGNGNYESPPHPRPEKLSPFTH